MVVAVAILLEHGVGSGGRDDGRDSGVAMMVQQWWYNCGGIVAMQVVVAMVVVQ